MTPEAAALACVPGAATGPVELRALAGGLTNRSFLVATPRGRYVLRLGAGADSLLAIDRRAEAAAQGLAAAAGIAPEIVHADPAAGLLVTQYVAGQVWSDADFDDPRNIDRLGEVLRRLHAVDTIGTAGLARLDRLETARGYVERIAAAAPAERAGLERLLAAAATVEAQVASDSRPVALVHSDLHGSNLVDDGEQLWLIDWEYAALADPLHDVACVLAYQPRAQRHGQRLLGALGLGRDVTAPMLAAAAWMFELLVYLWYRARRLAVPPSAAVLAAERRAQRMLVHNRNL
ncbi:MAG: phosphotransferase family protein [Steroidobacteraceae bacterium]|nr:phosphotransferase family protein [Steroidobacteraceae bacterium]